MKTTRLWVTAMLPLALVACGGGDEEAAVDGDTTMIASPETVPSTPAAGTADTTTMDASSAAAVTMNAVGNSGITGQAQLMAHGANETMVTVNLTGQGSGTHPGHIHQGTCDSPGQVVAPLQDVTLANGAGTASSTVPVALATVANGQHIVAYHGAGGAPVVCGQIPAGTGQAM